MSERRPGRPKNTVLKTSLYISLTFEELNTLERAAWFRSVLTGKFKTRNDAIHWVIEKKLKPQVEDSEKDLMDYDKQLKEKGGYFTQEGFREYWKSKHQTSEAQE